MSARRPFLFGSASELTFAPRPTPRRQVVDVLQERATFLASSPSAGRLVEQAWGCALGAEGTCVLPGVLSRKKQIIPTLEAAAARPPAPREREAVGVTPSAHTVRAGAVA